MALATITFPTTIFLPRKINSIQLGINNIVNKKLWIKK